MFTSSDKLKNVEPNTTTFLDINSFILFQYCVYYIFSLKNPGTKNYDMLPKAFFELDTKYIHLEPCPDYTPHVLMPINKAFLNFRRRFRREYYLSIYTSKTLSLARWATKRYAMSTFPCFPKAWREGCVAAPRKNIYMLFVINIMTSVIIAEADWLRSSQNRPKNIFAHNGVFCVSLL